MPGIWTTLRVRSIRAAAAALGRSSPQPPCSSRAPWAGVLAFSLLLTSACTSHSRPTASADPGVAVSSDAGETTVASASGMAPPIPDAAAIPALTSDASELATSTPGASEPALSTFDAGGRPPWTLDVSGTKVSLAVGETRAIALPRHVGSGFVWEAKPLYSYVPVGEPDSGIGAIEMREASVPARSHSQVFLLSAMKPGEGHVEIVLRRPWEHVPAAKTFTLDVVVR